MYRISELQLTLKNLFIFSNRLKLVSGKSGAKDYSMKRNSLFWWNITLCLCSMFQVMTRNSWPLCCATELWHITTLGITNKDLKMLRVAQDSDQTGTRLVDFFIFAGTGSDLICYGTMFVLIVHLHAWLVH